MPLPRQAADDRSDHFEWLRLARRWKRVVQLTQVVVGQSQRERAVILPHVIRCAGFGDRDHVRLPQDPREAYLRERRPVPNGDLFHDFPLQEPRLLDG